MDTSASMIPCRGRPPPLDHTIRTATGLTGRDQLAELIVLAAVAQEHLLVIGPPGTGQERGGRGAWPRRWAGATSNTCSGASPSPRSCSAPVDLNKLREGTVETDVTGMLPEADVAFLDEVFLGSTAILNTLLGDAQRTPLPARPHAASLPAARVAWARPTRCPTTKRSAPSATASCCMPSSSRCPTTISKPCWRPAGARTMTPAGGGRRARGHGCVVCQPSEAGRTSEARAAGAGQCHPQSCGRRACTLSDRRIVKSQRLRGRRRGAGRPPEDQAKADLWPLLYVLPTNEVAAQSARDVLRDVACANAHYPHLLSAVEEATLQPLSRAARLAETARGCSIAVNGCLSQVEAVLVRDRCKLHPRETSSAACRAKLMRLMVAPA